MFNVSLMATTRKNTVVITQENTIKKPSILTPKDMKTQKQQQDKKNGTTDL